MNWISGLFIYLVIWWVVLFAVLPWGVRAQEQPEPGTDTGAPHRPHMMLKFVATTVVAAIVWGVFYVLFTTGVIDWWQLVDPR